MNIQQKCARARHKAATKEGSNNALRQPSATAPTRRDTPKGARQNLHSAWFSKTYHLTRIHHKTCLKHTNFLNRKLCPIFTNMEHHGNSKGTGNRRKNKIRQNYNILVSSSSCMSLMIGGRSLLVTSFQLVSPSKFDDCPAAGGLTKLQLSDQFCFTVSRLCVVGPRFEYASAQHGLGSLSQQQAVPHVFSRSCED